MARPEPQRGEVWIIDLGLVAKIRPCAVFSVQTNDVEAALVSFVERTTSDQPGSRFQVRDRSRLFPKAPSVFDAQKIATVDRSKFQRRVGKLTAKQFAKVEAAVKRWLGLSE